MHIINTVSRAFSLSFAGRKIKYIAGWVLSSLEFLMVFITPFMFSQIITAAEQHQGPESIAGLFIIFILLAPLVCLGNYMRNISVAESLGFTQQIVFNHLQHLPVSKISAGHSGDYINRLANDVDSMSYMFRGFAFFGLFRFLVYFIVSFILLAMVSLELLFISFIFAIVIFAVTMWFSPKLRTLETDIRKASSESTVCLVEVFGCMPIIRVFLLKDIMLSKYRKACRAIMEKRISLNSVMGSSYAVSDFASGAVRPVGIIAAAVFMLGRMDMADIIFAVTVMSIMSNSSKDFNGFINSVTGGIAAAGRVFEVLDTPKEGGGNSVLQIDKNAKYAISFDNVSFSYPGKDSEILKGISFNIRNGEKAAIVGESGSGKTTILKLLHGFYQKTSGEIRLFGQSIESLSPESMREQLSWVSQECFLFDGTILENISMGKEYSMDAIEDAAQKANIHEFILSLPDGYNANVGERGALLSGGQKQRISIARAILKNAPILILDEATAALDFENEASIHAMLKHFSADKTVLIITHRLTKNVDKVINLMP